MRFKPDFETLNGIYDSTERIALVKRFLAASNSDDYEELSNQYQLLFGEHALGQSAEDVEAVCTMMHKANEIYALIRAADGLSIEDIDDMLKCGLSPVMMGIGESDDAIDDIPTSSYMLSYSQEIRGGNYCDWLSRAAIAVNNRFPWYRLAMKMQDGWLIDDAELRPISEHDKLREDCSYILEQLITLHLADVATICDESLRPAQMASSGISSLWLGLVERMSGGRSFRCEACDKPSIAYGERRRKHYCCDACRKWGNKHPGEKREHWYYEQR